MKCNKCGGTTRYYTKEKGNKKREYLKCVECGYLYKKVITYPEKPKDYTRRML